MSNPNSTDEKKGVEAYERMMSRVHQSMAHVREESQEWGNRLEEALDKARNTAVELGELSREEAEKVSGWIARDIKAAASEIRHKGRNVLDWLDIDPEQIENSVWKMLAPVADPTIVEMDRLQMELESMAEYHTGEVCSAGVLVCTQCGELLHFRKTGRIPPCPKCHGTVFRRPA